MFLEAGALSQLASELVRHESALLEDLRKGAAQVDQVPQKSPARSKRALQKRLLMPQVDQVPQKSPARSKRALQKRLLMAQVDQLELELMEMRAKGDAARKDATLLRQQVKEHERLVG